MTRGFIPRVFRMEPTSPICCGRSARKCSAFAPVAARILPSVHLTVPKPLLHVGGTEDRQIAFADQKEAIEAARRANGATGKGESCGQYCTRYESKDGAPVMTIIHSGGHVYPLEVAQYTVDFFKKYSLGLN